MNIPGMTWVEKGGEALRNLGIGIRNYAVESTLEINANNPKEVPLPLPEGRSVLEQAGNAIIHFAQKHQ